MSRSRVFLMLGSIVVVLAMISLGVGKASIPLSAWLAPADDPRWIVILELRLPRTALAALIGAALGLCGAALQGYTRNPLVDPAVLGVSSMAALGAVMTFYLGAIGNMPGVVPAGAMAGAMIGAGILLALAGIASSVVTFVLAGVVLNIVAGAGVSLALSLAPDPWAVAEIVNWLMGALTDRSSGDFWMALPFVVIGCVMIAFTTRALDALTLGEVGARSLGINLAATRWLLVGGVGLAAGASVAVTGVVGFVGLVTPHLLRPLVGAKPSALLWPSAVGGAAVVLLGDIIVRLLPAATEVKLGVAMAAFGGPFFLALLFATRRRLA